MPIKLSEREWIELNSKKHADDQQGFYYAQLQAILRGELDMMVNDEHLAALEAEIQGVLSTEPIKETLPF